MKAKIKAIFYAPISIVATLLTWLICPILPLFVEMRKVPWADEPRPMLKGWLVYLQTHDTDLDAGHRTGKYWVIDKSSKIQVYWSRVRWIYRNPIYGLQHYILGCWVKEPFVKYYNKDEVTDILQSDGYFCWRNKFVLPVLGLKLKYKFGWKLFRYNKPCDIVNGHQRAMYVCSLMRDK